MKRLMDYRVGELVTIEKTTWAYIHDDLSTDDIGRIDIGDVVLLVKEPARTSRWTRRLNENAFGRWRALTKNGPAFIDIGSEGA